MFHDEGTWYAWEVQLVFEGGVRNEPTEVGKVLWRRRLMFASRKFLSYCKKKIFFLIESGLQPFIFFSIL